MALESELDPVPDGVVQRPERTPRPARSIANERSGQALAANFERACPGTNSQFEGKQP
ncbi:hypothetical protein [Streptomyces lydicus]|uniref:hypothetical protein n=1 Tax=Streptomyces lydicus TaxID=47763 RepID=UPI0013E35E65|nr:hypothetical protein [Streptomyces lydicus]